MKTLAIIPARGGSKGLPRKNLAVLAGRPLLAYSIAAANECEDVTRTLVSSDDPEILAAAKALGAHALLRPAELATDECASEPVIEHALLAERRDGREYELVVLLQPTSPLRDHVELARAFAALRDGKGRSLISVTDFGAKPYKAFVLDASGSLRGLIDDRSPFRRRQDLPTTYLPNGAIYIAEVRGFLDEKSLLLSPCKPYVMTPEKSTDIDTALDLARVEALLQGRGCA